MCEVNIVQNLYDGRLDYWCQLHINTQVSKTYFKGIYYIHCQLKLMVLFFSWLHH